MPEGRHRRIAARRCSRRPVRQRRRSRRGQTLRDAFAQGATELAWQPYSLYGDGVVEGRAAEGAPDGDGGIGGASRSSSSAGR